MATVGKYNLWYVPTELNSLKTPYIILADVDAEVAQEHQYFEYADEPAPDANEFRHLIVLPVGQTPKIGDHESIIIYDGKTELFDKL